MSDRSFRLLVLVGVVGIWLLVLQNAGLLPPLQSRPVAVAGAVVVSGEVEISNTVEVEGTVDIDGISSAVDVNFAQVAGRHLVESEKGMYIGVSSADGHIIPVNWGEVSIE